MIKYAKVLLWMVCIGVFSNTAEAQRKFSLFGLGDFSSFRYNVPRANVSTSPKIGMGAGAQIEIDLGKSLGLEIGAIFVQRNFYVSDSLVPIQYNLISNGIQIPVQLRYWFLKIITVGFGAYYTMGLGNLTVSDSSNQAIVPNGSASYASRGLKKSDFGVIGSLGINIPLGILDVMAEARMAMGYLDLNDPTVPGLTTNTQDIQALVGVRF